MKKKNWKVKLNVETNTKLSADEVESLIASQLKYFFKSGRVEAK